MEKEAIEKKLKDYLEESKKLEIMRNRIKKLEKEVEAAKEEYRKYPSSPSLKEPITNVSLADLLQELSKLTGIPVCDIETEVEYPALVWGWEPEPRADIMLSQVNGLNINVTSGKYLREDGKPLFKYHLYTLINDFNDVQADGKTLYQHFGLKPKKYIRSGSYNFTNPNDIMCRLQIYQILKEEMDTDKTDYYSLRDDFYPAETFRQAIFNILEIENPIEQKISKAKHAKTLIKR